MELLTAPLLLLTGFYVGWNIGANDAANCIGTTVGAQIIPYRKAVVLMAVFVIIGGATQGQRVMETVGKGIVITDAAAYEAHQGAPPGPELAAFFPQSRVPDTAIFVALLCAGIFVTLATFFRVPVSTSQAIVGGVAGTGIGIVGLQPEYFDIGLMARIMLAWIVSPALTMLLSFSLYLLLSRLLQGVRSIAWHRAAAAGVVVSAAYVSFSLGANDVGNAIGPLLSRFPEHGLALSLLGGIAMAVGAMTFGARVTDTVGKSITPLDHSGALAAQFSAAIAVHAFSLAGIPVSTSQAIVGGVAGVGLTKGMTAVSRDKLRTIFLGWVLTPLGAAALAAGLFRLLFA